MRVDCTCARTPFGHEAHCDIFWLDDAADDHYSELLLDTDREDSLP